MQKVAAVCRCEGSQLLRVWPSGGDASPSVPIGLDTDVKLQQGLADDPEPAVPALLESDCPEKHLKLVANGGACTARAITDGLRPAGRSELAARE